MRKANMSILASILAMLLVAVAAGAGTMAYFTDTETSSENSFTAATVDLQLKDNDEGWQDSVGATWYSPNFAPGETVTATLQLRNVGTIDIGWIRIKPVITSDVAGLASVIIVEEVHISDKDGTNDYHFSGAFLASWGPSATCDVFGPDDGEMTLADFACGCSLIMDPGDFNLEAYGNNEVYIEIPLHFDEEAGDAYQGVLLTFDLYIGIQQNQPEGYWKVG